MCDKTKKPSCMLLKIPCNRPCYLEHKSFLPKRTAYPLRTERNTINWWIGYGMRWDYPAAAKPVGPLRPKSQLVKRYFRQFLPLTAIDRPFCPFFSSKGGVHFCMRAACQFWWMHSPGAPRGSGFHSGAEFWKKLYMHQNTQNYNS